MITDNKIKITIKLYFIGVPSNQILINNFFPLCGHTGFCPFNCFIFCSTQVYVSSSLYIITLW